MYGPVSVRSFASIQRFLLQIQKEKKNEKFVNMLMALAFQWTISTIIAESTKKHRA